MFIMIFSILALPVMEMGKVVFKAQLAEEEVKHCAGGCEDEPEVKLKSGGDPLHYPESGLQAAARSNHLSHQILTAIHLAEQMPTVFVPDVLSPPPDRA